MKNLIGITVMVWLLASCASDNSPTPLHSVIRIDKDKSAPANAAVAEDGIQFDTNVLSGVAAPGFSGGGPSVVLPATGAGVGTGAGTGTSAGTATGISGATGRTPFPGTSTTGTGTTPGAGVSTTPSGTTGTAVPRTGSGLSTGSASSPVGLPSVINNPNPTLPSLTNSTGVSP